MGDSDRKPLHIGWGQADLTPAEPVLLRGQFHVRLSEGVRDPITATALVLERPADAAGSGHCVVLVGCDLVAISDELQSAVERDVRKRLPELPLDALVLNGTHTHTAPYISRRELEPPETAPTEGLAAIGIRLGVDVMDPLHYVAFAAKRIGDAIAAAWHNRTPGGVSYGAAEVVISHNRRWTSQTGVSTMYGNVDDPGFSHVEGWEDHGLQLLCTWDPATQLADGTAKLTGMVVNVPCPSQVSEHEFQISADYWHDTRLALRRRFGEGLFVLPQCAPAGDLSPHHIVRKAAAARMLRLSGRTPRQEIAHRIAGAAAELVPHLQGAIEWSPAFGHRLEPIPLPRRRLTQRDLDEAAAEAERLRAQYADALRTFAAELGAPKQPRWYVRASAAYGRARWLERLSERYAIQDQPYVVRVHALRLGELALATNPFEYYVDFGLQIQARSRAEQTFLVQLAGSGTYLPTERAAAATGYGAVPASTVVGPPGGRQLAEQTIALINGFWGQGE